MQKQFTSGLFQNWWIFLCALLFNLNAPRLVCEDITGGQEDIPIPATNLVDDPPVATIGKWNNKVGLVSLICFDQCVRIGLDILVLDWLCVWYVRSCFIC